MTEHFVTALPCFGRLGHRFKSWIAGPILSEWFGMTYSYGSLEYNHRDWIDQWPGDHFTRNSPDAYFGFDALGIPLSSVRARTGIETFELPPSLVRDRIAGMDIDEVNQLISDFRGKYAQHDALLVLSRDVRIHLSQVYKWEGEGKAPAGLFHRIVSRLRGAYFARNAGRPSLLTPKELNIGIHIRRGDAYTDPESADSPIWKGVGLPSRFVPASATRLVVDNLLEIIPLGIPFSINLFTEAGNSADVARAFHDLPCVIVHRNIDEETVIWNLSRCDILVLSKGAFTTLLGTLGTGLKLFTPHFHFFDLPASEFLPIDEKLGTFDSKRVLQSVASIIENRSIS